MARKAKRILEGRLETVARKLWKPKQGYHVFDDEHFSLNLIFTDEELEVFSQLWSDGISLKNIATKMKRQPIEITLLVIDRAELKLINGRKTGIHGL